MRTVGWILALAASASTLAADTRGVPYPTVSPAWTLRLEQPVRWQRVHPMGALLLATDGCLHGVAPEKGTVAWSRCALDGPVETSYEVLQGTTLFVVSAGRLHERTLVVDAMDGHVVFDSRAAEIANILHRTVLFETGGLLILGQEQGDPTLKMFLADLATGKVRWTNEELVAGVSPGMKKLAGLLANLAQAAGKVPDDASLPAPLEVGKDAVILASGSEILKLSTENGSVLWRVPNRDGSGAAGLYVPQSRTDVLMVGTESAGITMSSGGASAPAQTLFSAYSLADGRSLWPAPIKMKGPLNPPVLLAHGALLSSGGGADGGIKLVEYGTGRSVWGKNGKGIGSDGGIVDYARTDAGLVVTTGKDSIWSNKGTVYSLNVLDLASGAWSFAKPVRAKGRLLWTETVPKGVLYVTTHEVNVFDPGTGSSAMRQALVSEGLVTADAGPMLYAFSPNDGGLWRVDKQEATAVRLNGGAVRLQGGDLPRALEVGEDRVTLLGMQSVVGFDLKGAIVFQAYHPAPRNPGWVRALAVAQSIRMGMAAAQAGMASAAFAQYASTQQDGTLGRALGDELARGYGQVSEAATGASTSYAAVARQRFQASAEARDFQFMMVQAERGFGIAQVDKATGEVRALLPIGRDRDPAYAVDDVARRVYYQPDDVRILGYAF